MHGEVHWIQNEPLSSEEEVLKRRSRFQKLRREMYSTLRLSHALRKAAYSDMKKQQIKERLQGANAAWQDKDTETEFVVVQKYLLLNFTNKKYLQYCLVFSLFEK